MAAVRHPCVGDLTYGADPVSLNLRLDQEKTLFGSSEVVTERAPVVEARLRPTPLLGQSLFVEATAQAGQLHLDRGPGQPSGTYGRFDLFPKVSAPLSPIPWLSIQANAGGRITWWGSSISSDPSTLAQTLTDASYVRKLGTVGIELTGPSFARIFEAKVGPYTKFKHVLEPIAKQVLDEGQAARVDAQSYFDILLMWQLAHGLAPKLIELPGGGNVPTRLMLKQRHGIIEAARAETVSLLNVLFLVAKGVFPPETALRTPVTHLASLFETFRYGTTDTRGLAKLIVYNYLASLDASLHAAQQAERRTPPISPPTPVF